MPLQEMTPMDGPTPALACICTAMFLMRWRSENDWLRKEGFYPSETFKIEPLSRSVLHLVGCRRFATDNPETQKVMQYQFRNLERLIANDRPWSTLEVDTLAALWELTEEKGMTPYTMDMKRFWLCASGHDEWEQGRMEIQSSKQWNSPVSMPERCRRINIARDSPWTTHEDMLCGVCKKPTHLFFGFDRGPAPVVIFLHYQKGSFEGNSTTLACRSDCYARAPRARQTVM